MSGIVRTQDEQATSVSRTPFPWLIHAGISCGFCGKSNIQGVRYKCIQCPRTPSLDMTDNMSLTDAEYDRCSACMGAPTAWTSHTPTHQFFPIHSSSAGNLEDYTRVKQSLSQQVTQYVHHGITCDGCDKTDIQGVRHKCLQCNDFDFCEQCIADVKQRQAHSLTHPFFPILSQLNTSAYSHIRELFLALTAQNDQQDASSHATVHCDGCNQHPLVGVRHKCFDCHNFDLCTRCISDPAQRLNHNLRHTFFPIPKLGEKSQFDEAVIVRNMGAM
ncbi:hypothetical protein C8Q74DRAFT_1256731 [Fomes fomentarius]|nr:hypothetical protein C8Q74DRAFT_1256731 [Fomes fomentarius]